ncbi:MAG: hypothetical protein V3V34_11840 [Kiloniellales bacterium]
MSAVEDKDLGLKKILAVAKTLPREIVIGIFQRKVLNYAFVVESRFHFLRDGTAAAEPEVAKRLDDLHSIIAAGKGNVRQAQKEIGNVIADAIRASIIDQNLIKTGAMLRSITVKERDVK